jgi:hypothetical protein
MRSNASTCLPYQIKLPLHAPSLETAYAVAVAADRVREEPNVGYRLYWMAEGRFGSFDVPLDPTAFIVVGRHAMCDVVLDGDPTIALRHLLVRASRLDDGCPRLSVVDLHTNIGFEVNGARQERSMALTGPVAFRVGAYALVALPAGEAHPPELPKPEQSRAMIPHPYRDAPISSITLLPRAIQLSETNASRGPGWTLTLQGARGSASLRLSPLDLELGVLVGRAPKCADALRSVMHDGISRVHLLLRKGVAYDLASTQGTYTFHRRIRSVPLDDEGVDLRLGTVSPVFMRFRAE